MKPARDLIWRTSNMEYGRFYALTSEEEQTRLAGDSEGRCEVLTKGMIKCRKQLGLMRLRDTSPDPELNDGFDTPTEKYFKSHLEKLRIADIERKRNIHLERLRKSATSHKPSERASKTTHLDDLSQMNSVKSNQSKTNNNSIPMDQLTTHKSNNARKSPSLDEATEGRISKLNGRMIDPASIEEDTIQLECILNRLAEKLQPLMNEDNMENQTPVQSCKQWQVEGTSAGLDQHGNNSNARFMKEVDPSRSRLPPYCRYGFYRHYGLAGQGAKTSWSHNLPLGQKPPFGKQAKGPFKS